ncbi:hypothetical protein [Vibrio phage PhiImVa-1]|nr:hypothetical protein [Vibrio phage PhiImVa-1]
MALPSTGSISLAQVNEELGKGSSTTISLGDAAVRELAGRATGAISMSDLRGKSAYITMTVGVADVYGFIIAGYSDGLNSATIGSLSDKTLGGTFIRALGTNEMENSGGGTIVLNEIQQAYDTIKVTNEVGTEYFFYSVAGRPEQYDNRGSTLEWGNFIAANVGKTIKIKVAFA